MKILPSHLVVILVVIASVLVATAQPAALAKKTRVACVGDSITQGGGADGGKSYPSQLQEVLGNGWEVGNFGVSARTLMRKGDFPYWNEDAFKKAQAFKPNVVIVMLGTNDSKPHNWQHKADFAKDYTDLIQTFLALESKPQVYICRPVPVVGDGAYGINESGIKEQIEILNQLAEKLPVGIIDMHAALLDHPDTIPDRVHPNAQGTALMAQAARKVLLEKFPSAGDKATR